MVDDVGSGLAWLSGQQSSLVSLGSDYSFESTPDQTRSELVKDGQRQIISGSSQLINSVRFSFSLVRSTASVRLRFVVRRLGSVDSVKPIQLGQNWSTQRVDSVNQLTRLTQSNGSMFQHAMTW
ncbi:hypothetical protein Hanom_Chr07g00627691 [Helianthus anomalus]